MDAITLVDRYLRLTAERRLDEAQAMLAPGARLVFPPGRRFSSLAEMAEAARSRYQWVDKRFERWDVLPQEDGSVVVYNLGTLFGVNRHGVPFEGIRYLDRFTVRAGLIVAQEVWNDLAESGVLERTG